MRKWTAALTVLVMLPTLVAAQSALPNISTPEGMQAHLTEIIRLMKLQVQLTQQAAYPTLDNTKACYIKNDAYSEGMPIKADTGTDMICERQYPVSGSTAGWRLAWGRPRY